jgi:microcystin-dependent protein
VDPFIGEIRLFPYNFSPRGWAFANGQLLPIAQNTALFSLLGTTYGGDGRTNFALPDLRGRAPIGAGQGPGLSQVDLGALGGGGKLATPASGDAGYGTSEATLALNWCIALQGIFPSRD